MRSKVTIQLIAIPYVHQLYDMLESKFIFNVSCVAKQVLQHRNVVEKNSFKPPIELLARLSPTNTKSPPRNTCSTPFTLILMPTDDKCWRSLMKGLTISSKPCFSIIGRVAHANKKMCS